MTSRAIVVLSTLFSILGACGTPSGSSPSSQGERSATSACTAAPSPADASCGTIVANDATCESLGLGPTSYVVSPVVADTVTYTLGGSDTLILSTSDLVWFNWWSTVGINAVLAKGALTANLYEYDPAAFSGNGLSSPYNPSLCAYEPLVAIEVCHGAPSYSLQASKTAATSFDRRYDWHITKTSSVSDVVLAGGEVFAAPFDVEASVVGVTDSSFAVSGNVVIHNPAPIDAVITAITDALDDGTGIPVDCHVTLPYTLAAGATLHCDYSQSLASATNGINYVTITTSGPVAGVGASAAVDFSSAVISTLDGCATVSDDHAGALGHVCHGDAPIVFHYTSNIGPFTCGPDEQRGDFTNVATLVTDDLCVQDSASWTITWRVPACAVGCTLTPGYWKTHSKYGPAPVDDAWALVGEDTAFFSSGKTWYQALWVTPRGNAYWILAHAYIAAALNHADGADLGAAQAAFTAATALLQGHTPAQIAALRGDDPLRAQLIAAASTLDAYNNGLIGPGHCSQDSPVPVARGSASR